MDCTGTNGDYGPAGSLGDGKDDETEWTLVIICIGALFATLYVLRTRETDAKPPKRVLAP